MKYEIILAAVGGWQMELERLLLGYLDKLSGLLQVHTSGNELGPNAEREELFGEDIALDSVRSLQRALPPVGELLALAASRILACRGLAIGVLRLLDDVRVVVVGRADFLALLQIILDAVKGFAFLDSRTISFSRPAPGTARQ